MADILSNSFKKQNANEMPKKIDPVVTLVEKPEDTGFLTKLAKAFVAVDPKTVGKSVLDQVIVPTVKRTLITSVTTGLSMLFNINVTPQIVDSVFGSKPGTRIGYTQYTNMSTQAQVQPLMAQPTARPVSGMERYAMFTYNSESDARTIIERMDELADVYDRAITVGHLCQLVGQSDTSTDYDFGWTREMIAKAKPVISIDGTWLISWPRPVAVR